MPRKGRIDAPGSLHHVIMRGIERSPLFRRSGDYKSFLARFADLLGGIGDGIGDVLKELNNS